MLDRIKALIKRQPIATIGASITTFVVAGIGVINTFQPGAVTDAQIEAIVKALGAMWVLLGIIWPTVTPAASPRLPESTPVKLPDGTAGKVVKL